MKRTVGKTRDSGWFPAMDPEIDIDCGPREPKGKGDKTGLWPHTIPATHNAPYPI
jgi:hypothetical protein